MARLLPPNHRRIGNLSQVDLRNMQLFRQVADAGGITAAAAHYQLEKSKVSRAIRALEQRLDGTLCRRGPRGFALTDYGREVYAATAGIEDAIDTARGRINEAHQSFEGEVRLGIADNCLTNEDAKISDALETFLAIAPAVRLEVAIQPPDRLTSAIVARELHLGIVSAEHQGAGLEGVPIFTETSRLYCCPQRDETPPRLERLVSRGYGVVQRRFLGHGVAKLSRQIAGAWTAEASGLEAVATLINTGRCVGFLPDHYVTGTRTRRPFIIVPGSEHLSAQTTFSVVMERDRTVSQAAAALRNILIDVAKRSRTVEKGSGISPQPAPQEEFPSDEEPLPF